MDKKNIKDKAGKTQQLDFRFLFFDFSSALWTPVSALLSAVLLILSHPPYHFWFFAWVALVPLFCLLEGKTFRQSFCLGYLFGAFYCFGMFWWFIHVTFPGMILLNLFLAVYFALFAGTYALIPKKSLMYRAVLTACAWVVWEFTRAHLLSGFGWAGLGHTQYQRIALIQIADITGVYGVSFILIIVNCFFYAALRYWRDRDGDGKELKQFMLSLVLLLGAVLIYGFSAMIALDTPDIGPSRIALIQPNIAQRHKWDPAWRMDILDQLKILSMEAAKEDPDVIVWPEAALPAAPYGLDEDMRHVQELAARLQIPFILGYVRGYGQTYYNTAGMISAHGDLLKEYDKLHLVPFGEFIPLRRIFSFLAKIVPIDDISAGQEPVVFLLAGKKGLARLSVLICFEDTVDGVANRMVNAGAQVLVNMTNDAWFHDTKAPWLHLQAAVFQAVSYKRPLVRSANTGVSAVVSPFGQIQEVLRAYDGKAAFRSGFLTAEVIPQTKKTLRSKFGDVFAYLCIATLLAGVIINIISIKLKRI